MKIRERIQNGAGRGQLTIVVPLIIAGACFYWWPSDLIVQEKWLNGLQKIAFVSAAFAVTAYNLRTRVVDFVLKIGGKPARVDEFCRIARGCGKRLTNLVLLFTVTAAWLGGLTLFTAGTVAAQIATVGALGLFSASLVSFVYIVFSFERLERFALDEAEITARTNEAARLFGDSDSESKSS